MTHQSLCSPVYEIFFKKSVSINLCFLLRPLIRKSTVDRMLKSIKRVGTNIHLVSMPKEDNPLCPLLVFLYGRLSCRVKNISFVNAGQLLLKNFNTEEDTHCVEVSH